MTGGPQQAALIAAIALVPFVVLVLTSFVKISVVLSLLRNAIGAPDAPSGLVVIGLSLILSFFVMAPVAVDVARAAAAPAPASPSGARPAPPAVSPLPPAPAVQPPSPVASPGAQGPMQEPPSPAAAPGTQGAAPAQPVELEVAIRELVPPAYRPHVDAAARALGPLRGFLARHAAARDRETFTALATEMGRAVRGDEIWVLAPAFVTTELREAFAIAVLIFVPFLIIDLVVGIGLAALGLAATSPQAVALPLKLLLFVSVDGWRLLIDGLLRGYA